MNATKPEKILWRKCSNKTKKTRNSRKQVKNSYCMILVLIGGILNIILGVLSIHYNYQKEYLKERMRMRPGLPPMELWRNPPIKILLKIFLYNVTNSDEFLNNYDAKLKVQEVGPIIYQQIIKQEDIIIHENNSTMSYSTVRTIKFLPDENEPGILNKTIIMLNTPLLGLAGFINNESFLKKIAFNIIAAKDHPFLKRTIYEVLWNNSVPVIDSIKKIAPFLVPRSNTGLLYNAYYPVQRRFNIKIGPDLKPYEFFEINTYNGETRLPGFQHEERDCSIYFNKTYDGTCLPPHLTKDHEINLWRDDLAKIYPFEYEQEVNQNTFTAYKFTLKNETYQRGSDSEMDCFRGDNGVNLPDGLIDASKISFDLPVAYSNPHFYGFNGPWENYIEGMHPNKGKHLSYFVVEPQTGVSLTIALRAQCNLPMPAIKGFNRNIERFKNMVIPSFWAEYVMEEVTTSIIISAKLYHLLPIIQPILIILYLVSGLFSITFSIRKLIYIRRCKHEKRLPENLSCSKPLTNCEETETMI